MKNPVGCGCLALCLMLAGGCGERTSKAPKETAKATAPAGRTVVDADTAERVPMNTTGSGADPYAVVNEALRGAILSVNGPAMQSRASELNFGFQAAQALRAAVTEGKFPSDPARGVQEGAFADQIVSHSKGLVPEFRVTGVSGPDASGIYTLSIQTKIARIAAPAAAPPAAAKK